MKLDAMVIMNPPDFVSSPEFALLRSLASQARPRRPNLLVFCPDAIAGEVLRELRTVCAAPVHACALPGRLDLPDRVDGTLFLHDVAELTIAQQIALFDWLGRDGRRIQIVSITRAQLTERVENGRFLESLFYRLNGITLHARRPSNR